jgi:cytochrome b involved in lipid metabolism
MPSSCSKTIRVYYRGNKYEIPEDFATRMHPGGKGILMRYKDCDITKAFEKTNHTVDAVVMLNAWAADNVEYAVPVKDVPTVESDAECEEVQKKECEKTKRWNRLAIAFGIASIVAAVQMRKH